MENASDQVLIGCSIQYDWLRRCASFYTYHRVNENKTIEMPIYF